MSAEQTPSVKSEVTPPVAPELPIDPSSLEAIEARLSKRAKEVNEKVARLEKSQIVTRETIELEFTI